MKMDNCLSFDITTAPEGFLTSIKDFETLNNAECIKIGKCNKDGVKFGEDEPYIVGEVLFADFIDQEGNSGGLEWSVLGVRVLDPIYSTVGWVEAQSIDEAVAEIEYIYLNFINQY